MVVVLVCMPEQAFATSQCLCSGGWGSSTPNGCTISAPTTAGSACQCYFIVSLGRAKCFSNQVACVDPNNYYCQHPDTSKASCLQAAGGNCLGYP